MSGEVNSEANAPAATPVVTSTAPAELPSGTAPVTDGAAAPEQPQDQQQPADAAPQPQEEQPQQPSRATARFADLTRERNKAREDAAYWRGIAEAARQNGGQAPTQPEPAQVAPQALVEPDPSKYAQGKYDPDFAADLAVYRLDKRAREEREATAQAERTAESQREFQAGLARYEDTLTEARGLADGQGGEFFQNAERVLGLGRVPLNQGGLPKHVIDAITESDNRVHVAEVLGRKPELVPEALRPLVKDVRDLAKLPPAQAVRAIARLDDRIGLILEDGARTRAAQPAPAPKPAPQPSPAPIPTVTASGAAPPQDLNKGTMEDYARSRGYA